MNRSNVLGLVLMFCGISAFAGEQELPAGFSVVNSSMPYVTVLTPFATYPVTLEEYIPEIILQGKYGSGPGQFGTIDDPILAEAYMIDRDPSSFALDSKRNIYVLDQVNNRIEKFSSDGKYLTSLPVLSFALKNKEKIDYRLAQKASDLIVNLYYRGKNIVIDSDDNLYYCCWKTLKAGGPGKGKGDIYHFKNDKLIKKWEVPFIPDGLKIDNEGRPYIQGGDNFDIYGKKIEGYSSRDITGMEFSLGNRMNFKFLKVDPKEVVFQLDDQDKKNIFEIRKPGKNIWVSREVKKTDTNEILVFIGDYGSSATTMLVLKEGKIQSLMFLDLLPDLSRIDAKGNIYRWGGGAWGDEYVAIEELKRP